MSVATALPEDEVVEVARSKRTPRSGSNPPPQGEKTHDSTQVSLRIPNDLLALVREIEVDMGLDRANVLRFILVQHVDFYVERARDRRQKKKVT